MAVIAVLRSKWRKDTFWWRWQIWFHWPSRRHRTSWILYMEAPMSLKVTVQNAPHLETCIWKSGGWQQLSLLKSSHCKFELITIIMGQLSMTWAAPNTSIALIWGRLAPFKVHLCTHIIRKQVSGVRWRFLESHWIRLLRSRVIEGTVACWQSSSISLFSWCHFSNLLENNFNHLSCIPLKKTNKIITFGYHQERQAVKIL